MNLAIYAFLVHCRSSKSCLFLFFLIYRIWGGMLRGWRDTDLWTIIMFEGIKTRRKGEFCDLWISCMNKKSIIRKNIESSEKVNFCVKFCTILAPSWAPRQFGDPRKSGYIYQVLDIQYILCWHLAEGPNKTPTFFMFLSECNFFKWNVFGRVP